MIQENDILQRGFKKVLKNTYQRKGELKVERIERGLFGFYRVEEFPVGDYKNLKIKYIGILYDGTDLDYILKTSENICA